MIENMIKNDTPDTANDEVLYEYVIDEMEQQTTTKGIWAKAVAHSDGDAEKTKSLYMRYKVQSIKDSFALYGVAYDGLSKDEIGAIVKDDFKDLQEAYNIKQETQTKKEDEKYEKIGGWLYLFGFLFVFSIIPNITGFREVFFNEENFTMIKYTYLAYPDMVGLLTTLIFFSFINMSIFVAVILAFFNKSNLTLKIIGIHFVSMTVNIALSFYIIAQFSSPAYGEVMAQISIMMGAFAWICEIIFMIYYYFSKRAKKTFVKQPELAVFIFLASILMITLSIIYFNKIKSIPDEATLQQRVEQLARKTYVEKDYKEAIFWYSNLEKRVDTNTQKHKEALRLLGLSHVNLKNYFKAIRHYQKMIDMYGEDGIVMYHLGFAYNGLKAYDKADMYDKKAFVYFLEEAKDGNKRSMKLLGIMYKHGIGIKKDLKKAKYWIDRSGQND